MLRLRFASGLHLFMLRPVGLALRAQPLMTKRFDFLSRFCGVFKEPGAEMGDDDTSRKLAEEFDQIRNPVVSKGRACFGFDSYQTLRSYETSFRNNEIEISEQTMILGLNADHI